jgi:hypothetical protein
MGKTAETTAGLRGVLILDAFGLLFRILLGGQAISFA